MPSVWMFSFVRMSSVYNTYRYSIYMSCRTFLFGSRDFFSISVNLNHLWTTTESMCIGLALLVFFMRSILYVKYSLLHLHLIFVLDIVIFTNLEKHATAASVYFMTYGYYLSVTFTFICLLSPHLSLPHKLVRVGAALCYIRLNRSLSNILYLCYFSRFDSSIQYTLFWSLY